MTRAFLLSLAILFMALVGCSNSPTPPPAVPTPGTGHDDHAKASAHGGVMVEIGEEVAHAEAVFEADGTVRLYLLGKDAKSVIEIDAKPVEAFAKPDGGSSAVRFEFTPALQPGDSTGKASLFVGKLPAAVIGQPVGVSIPNLRVGADRFRVGFHSRRDGARRDAGEAGGRRGGQAVRHRRRVVHRGRHPGERHQAAGGEVQRRAGESRRRAETG